MIIINNQIKRSGRLCKNLKTKAFEWVVVWSGGLIAPGRLLKNKN